MILLGGAELLGDFWKVRTVANKLADLGDFRQGELRIMHISYFDELMRTIAKEGVYESSGYSVN